MKSETSELRNTLELKLKKMKEDETCNLNSLAKKFEDNKSEINDLLKTQNVQIGGRLSESDKWMSELKTNLSFLISESDLIKANLKKYQDAFEQVTIFAKAFHTEHLSIFFPNCSTFFEAHTLVDQTMMGKHFENA